MFKKKILNYEHNINTVTTGGVIVGVLASSAVDRGFDPRSGHTIDYNISMC